MKYFKGSGVSYKSLGTSALDIRSRFRWYNDYRACHWTQGSRVQTRPRTMDFKGGKIHSTTSFGEEVKLSAPYKILRHVKEP
jgi:hypothetical protein